MRIKGESAFPRRSHKNKTKNKHAIKFESLHTVLYILSKDGILLTGGGEAVKDRISLTLCG
jgi:hypothetical protein